MAKRRSRTSCTLRHKTIHAKRRSRISYASRHKAIHGQKKGQGNFLDYLGLKRSCSSEE